MTEREISGIGGAQIPTSSRKNAINDSAVWIYYRGLGHEMDGSKYQIGNINTVSVCVFGDTFD